MRCILIARISVSRVLPELFLTIDFSVFIYITSSYTAQHQELDDGHLLGENGTGCGSGCGWGGWAEDR